MAAEASVGLMLWDGESRGTLLNVMRLVAQEKPAFVYVVPEKAFTDVRSDHDLERLAAGLDRSAVKRLRALAVRRSYARLASGMARSREAKARTNLSSAVNTLRSSRSARTR